MITFYVTRDRTFPLKTLMLKELKTFQPQRQLKVQSKSLHQTSCYNLENWTFANYPSNGNLFVTKSIYLGIWSLDYK